MTQQRNFDHLTGTGERKVVVLPPDHYVINDDHSGYPLMSLLAALNACDRTLATDHIEGLKQIILLLLTHLLSEKTQGGSVDWISVSPAQAPPLEISFRHTWKEIHVTGRYYFQRFITLSL